MKARINKEPQGRELVILYKTDELDDSEKLDAVLRKLQIESKLITEDMLQEKVGYLAEIKTYEKNTEPHKERIAWEEDMPTMLISGITRTKMNSLLDLLQKEKIFVPLKAVVTDFNKDWSFAALLDELMQEFRHFEAEHK